MQRIKPSVVLGAAAVVGVALYASAYVEQTGSRMAVAARRFLDSLPREKAEKATFKFDVPERINWHFIPRDRLGLPIKELTSEQRALAFGLIATGLGGSGNLKATTIMSLEQILLELEQGKGPLRDPERYFLTIFGTPSDRGKWGWRVEGHHLSLNFVLDDGKIIAATPSFFGPTRPRSARGPGRGSGPLQIARIRRCGWSRPSMETSRRRRSSRPRPPRKSAPRARLSRPPTPRRESPTTT